METQAEDLESENPGSCTAPYGTVRACKRFHAKSGQAPSDLIQFSWTRS